MGEQHRLPHLGRVCDHRGECGAAQKDGRGGGGCGQRDVGAHLQAGMRMMMMEEEEEDLQFYAFFCLVLSACSMDVRAGVCGGRHGGACRARAQSSFVCSSPRGPRARNLWFVVSLGSSK